MKKILFISGTRADYGKIKPLISSVEALKDFEAYIFVSGMHLLEVFGYTYNEVLKDNYKNAYVAFGLVHSGNMSYDLGDVICQLSGYVKNVKPDLVVIHGDRIDALAGAVVGALNNIRVAHIEGGEISGTIDESIRHAISKFAHIHLVCNEEARNRLIQMGEDNQRIFILGSPDIDIMMSDRLPTIDAARKRYGIDFDRYGILMYHPVTTEYPEISKKIKAVVDALIISGKNYIVIYPNNDLGSEIILNEYRRFEKHDRFKSFSSLRFEHFLTFLGYAEFLIGNSSAGVKETGIYGVPAIDIGTRQSGRYSLEKSRNINHVPEDTDAILDAIAHVSNYRFESSHFGDGKSTERFMDLLNNPQIWNFEIQKRFIDLDTTI